MNNNGNNMKNAKTVVAFNKVTGLYWDGQGFQMNFLSAKPVDLPELAVLRATYDNVLTEQRIMVRGRTNKVGIVKATNGNRAVKVQPVGGKAYYVPLEIAGLAAGKDAWLRDVLCRCTECRSYKTTAELNEGGYCESCVEKSFAEDEG